MNETVSKLSKFLLPSLESDSMQKVDLAYEVNTMEHIEGES